VDATTIVAIAGLTATTSLGLVVPIINGRIADRNARRAKAHDLVIATYVDAMAYVQLIEVGIDHLVDPSGRKPAKYAFEHANVDLITARLRLIAPRSVVRCWLEFVDADETLGFHVREECDPRQVEYDGLPEDTTYVVAVRQAAITLGDALREAAGTTNLYGQPN
jgi:hypothetical protein